MNEEEPSSYPSLQDMLDLTGDSPAAADTPRPPTNSYAALKRLAQPSAPPASKPSELQPRIPPSNLKTRVEIPSAARVELNACVCGFCNAPIGAANVSVVIFGVCNHIAHFLCVKMALQNLGDALKLREDGFFVGGVGDSVCMQCVKDAIASRDAIAGNPHMDRAYRDRGELLQSYKLVFRKKNGKNYETFKNEPVDIKEKRRLLRAPVKSEPYQLTKSMLALAERIRPTATTSTGPVRTHGELVDLINQYLEDDYCGRGFVQCMLELDRKIDDVIECGGSLLTLYQCGVRSLDDLFLIGFDPLIHLEHAYRETIPVWQLHDLYGFVFSMLIDNTDSRWGLQMRNICECTSLRVAEWALIGADVYQFLLLGMTRQQMKLFKFSVSQWQRYLLLEPAHLTQLGLTTRKLFLEIFKNDESHEFCPRN